ncbi:MAG TPA: Na+/H+ antiporter subunit E [Phycisphaerales bacterium]|nr:Na+/H+ antiporter subunit E [Phycisphaerales bacterium]HCD35175.1 Na+/H+ antiporter subunit E [Phycisphaerales bacterium]|tara:strand:+ start:299 stop:784 length:486 start_codon:yes stop_codon:yes gene_type:complete
MLAYFLINVLLAVLWMCMWGLFDIWTMLAGFFFGYLLLGAVSRTWYPDGKGYGSKLLNLASFGIYFIRILIQANLTVAKEVVTPKFNMTPRFVRYPVKGMTPLQITSLANAITLTPGTLSVDVLDNDEVLLVHCMYAEDRQSAIKELDELRDRLMTEVFGC